MTRKCSICNKRECAKRVIDNDTNICQECSTHDEENANAVDFGDDDSLVGDIKFPQFKLWLTSQLNSFLRGIAKEEVEKIVKPLNDEMKKLKKDLDTTRESLKIAESKVNELEACVKTLNDNVNGVQMMSNNNVVPN